MDITDFLLARLDEKETLAHEAMGRTPSFEGGDADWCPDWLATGIRHLVRNCDVECYTHDADGCEGDCGWPHRYAGTFIADNDPKYVLADVAAKRKIIKKVGCDYYSVLEELVAPFSDHPDYDPEWAL